MTSLFLALLSSLLGGSEAFVSLNPHLFVIRQSAHLYADPFRRAGEASPQWLLGARGHPDGTAGSAVRCSLTEADLCAAKLKPRSAAVATTFVLGSVLMAATSPALASESASLAVSASTLEHVVGPGFVQAFSLIFVSEIGDKTFFIAALLAAKFSRLVSFVGSVGALVVMTFISVALGQLFNAVPAGLSNGLPLDDIAASLAFAYFGFRTLTEALQLDGGEKGGELLDAEEALEDVDSAGVEKFWSLVLQTFVLVFAAEFGDRSFLSTIALAAAQNPTSVASGAIAAHTIATTGAVTGGAILSKYISEKLVGICGGSLFILFSLQVLGSLVF
jgi:putative Ca2+/H+ antiporter (TMEM165/GDT1 family)